jgi:hypothetical protein
MVDKKVEKSKAICCNCACLKVCKIVDKYEKAYLYLERIKDSPELEGFEVDLDCPHKTVNWARL